MLAPRHLLLLGMIIVPGCGSTPLQAPLARRDPPSALIVAEHPTSKESVERADPPNAIRRASDGLFYVSAAVNGIRVRFVVDSGSSTVVLNRSDAQRAGIARSSDASLLQTAGGVTRMQRAILRDLTIAGRSLKDVDAAIVEEGMHVSLLGQSALSRLEAVNFSGDTLEIR